MMRKALALTLLLAGCSQAGQGPDPTALASTCTGIAASEMIWVHGGTITLGEDPKYPEEGPPREVSIEGFWISKTEVTNAQFAKFIAATGYKTEAERDPVPVPGVDMSQFGPGSAVFRVPTSDNPNWWAWVDGAWWQAPNGPGSSIEGRGNDPVVQVTYNDALAYAEWAGVSLPSEDQWEFAARAGERAIPEPVDEAGKAKANYYQGVFPAKDLGEDGFTSRAPVGCFEANAYGLHDMIGNVWEWTSNTARPESPRNIIKGGSFLCAANYCARYRPAARQFQERDLGTDHIGFRVVDTKRPAKSD